MPGCEWPCHICDRPVKVEVNGIPVHVDSETGPYWMLSDMNIDKWSDEIECPDPDDAPAMIQRGDEKWASMEKRTKSIKVSEGDKFTISPLLHGIGDEWHIRRKADL